MKVFGQLEYAQLETLATDPSNLPLGRFWANIAAPSAALPKFFDGTSIRTLAFASTTQAVFNAGAAGQAKAINWANGSVQKINLTDAYCNVTFTGNPGDGLVCKLIVENFTNPGAVNFDVNHDAMGKPRVATWMAANTTRIYSFLYTATPSTSLTNAYFSSIPMSFSAGATTARAIDVSYQSPSNRGILVGTTGTSAQMNYSVFDILGNYANIGTKAATTYSTGTIQCAKYSPDGLNFFVSSSVTPFIYGVSILPYDNRDGGSNYSSPGTLPSNANGLDVHPQNYAVAIAHSASPWVNVYPWSRGTNGFGTKWANPGTLPTATSYAHDVAFSPAGDYLAVLTDTTPFLMAYSITAGAFTARITDPTGTAAQPTAAVSRIIAWRPQSDWIAYGLNASPFLYQTPFNRAAGTFGSPVVPSGVAAPTVPVLCSAFSPDGLWLALGLSGDNEPLRIYKFSPTTGVDFSVNYAPLAFLSSNSVKNIVWDRLGDRLYYVGDMSTPRMVVLPFVGRNWLRQE